MKNKFENNLADIIFGFREKSFRMWIVLVIIQGLQLMEAGAYLISQLTPQNYFLYILRKILGIITLRTISQEFFLVGIILQIIYFGYLVLLIGKLSFGTPNVGAFLNYSEIWCPVLITLSIQSIKYDTQAFKLILSFITAISSAFFWLIKLQILKQNNMSQSVKLSSIKSTIRMIIICFQNIILCLQLTDLIAIIFISISLGLIYIAGTLALTIMQNIDEQLQYLHYLKCICAGTFHTTLLVVYFIPELDYLFLGSLLLILFIERVGILKQIFEIKYNVMIKNVVKTQKDQSLVILLELVGGTQNQNQNNYEKLKGRSKNLWTNKPIQFKFHSKAKQACIELAIKKSTQTGKSKCLIDILKQQPCFIIEQCIQKKSRSKSKLLAQVLVCQFIKRQLLIKALSIHSSIIGQMNINQRIMKKVLKLQIQNASNIKDKMGSIYQLSDGLCCLNTSIIKSKIDQIILLHNFFENFLKKMIELSRVFQNFYNKLSSRSIQADKIMSVIQQQAKIKQNLLDLTKNSKQVINKQIIVLFYLYFGHFNSQKFSIFQTLGQHLITLDKLPFELGQKSMVCLVSASQHNRGSLMNANHQMVEFFGLDFQHIKQGVSHIQDILPKPLSIIHNFLIARCLDTGLSKIIGVAKQFYVIKGRSCYPVQFTVKFQPYLQGIHFSCQLRSISDQCFVLFDKHNEILGFSQTAQWTLPKKKLQARYLSQIFGVRKTPKSSDSSLTLKGQNKYHPDNKKYNTVMSTYTTNDFQIGICKFQKNQLGFSGGMVQKSQVFQWDGNQSQKSNHLFILEDKINCMSEKSDLTNSSILVILIYGICLTLLTTIFYVFVQKSIQKISVISHYQQNIFDDNPINMFVGIDFSFNLNFAISNQYIPETITIRNQSILPFMYNNYQGQLANILSLKNKMFRSVKNIPQNLLNLIVQLPIYQKTISGIQIQLPFHSFITFFFDRKLQASRFSLAQWKVRRPGRPHIAHMNVTIKQMQILFAKLFNAITIQINKLRKVLITLMCVVQGVTIIGIILCCIFFHKVIKQKGRFINLLSQLQNKLLNRKIEINQRISHMLNILMKSSFTNLILDQSTETLQFKYGHNIFFDENKIQVYDNQINGNLGNKQRYKSSSKKQVKYNTYERNQYKRFMISILIFIPIFTMTVLGYTFTNDNTFKALSYYQKFALADGAVSKCAGLLLDANTMVFSRNSDPVYGMQYKDLFNFSYSCIAQRTIENILKDFVPNVSKSMSVSNEIQDYIYEDKCQKLDSRCQNILSGSITRGMPSALLSFITLSSSLNNKIINFTGPYPSNILSQLQQSLQAYIFYIRQILSFSRFVLDKIQNIFQTNTDQVYLFLVFTLLSEFFLALTVIAFIKSQRRRIWQLKKQTLTVLPVDILSENINFNFQIKNIQ